MTLQRNSSPARKTAAPGAQDGMGTRATGKRSPGKMWDRTHPPVSTEHTAKRRSHGLDAGQRWRGGASPPAAAGRLPVLARFSPARRGHCLRCGGAGIPVAYPKRRLSAPHGCLRRALEPRSFSDPFRERAGCLQELKLLCKEQRRYAGAGRRPRGPPPPRGCSRRRRRCRARSQIGGGHSRARLLLRQARQAPTCPRRAAPPGQSLGGRGCSFAGGGGGRTRSSAPAAPQQPSRSPGKGLRRRLAARQGRSWVQAEGLRFCCKVTRGRWKLRKRLR